MKKGADIAEDGPLIEVRRDLAVRDLERLFDVTIGLFKWMITTLLALNGAALLAIMGAADLRNVLVSGPMWPFAGGVFLALGGGIAVVLGFARIGEELFEALWRGDDLSVKSYDDFAPKSNQPIASLVGAVLLALSVVCFVWGCIWSGYAASNGPKTAQVMKVEEK